MRGKSRISANSSHFYIKSLGRQFYQNYRPNMVLQRGLEPRDRGMRRDHLDPLRSKNASRLVSGVRVFSTKNKRNSRPGGGRLFLWCSSGDSNPVTAACAAITLIRCAQKMLRILVSGVRVFSTKNKRNSRPGGGRLFLWCSSGDSNPGHPA